LAIASISRRRFVIQALLGGSALAGSGAFARTIQGEMPWLPGQADTPAGLEMGRYFTREEADCVSAIASRLIPSDENGPGAREANVTGFIDRELASFFGRGDRWYMQGPHPTGTKQQGYQSEFPPALLYRNGIAALDAHCRKEFGNRRFSELPEKEQDAILGDLEDGKIEFEGVSASLFFEIVMENTIEGFFCDPIYGGNRDMVGWRLVGFPGARYDYRDFLNHDGARIDIEPVGLRGRPAWNPA
jgi:gluconate 2-dehydrogenase gamma chain